MNTSILSLLSKVDREDMIKYIDGLSYDDLIVFDPVGNRFKSLFHVPKKYALPLSEGSFTKLIRHMSDALVHSDDQDRFRDFVCPETLCERLESSDIPGMVFEEFHLRMFGGGWRWTELIILSGDGDWPFRMYFIDTQSRKNRQLGLSGDFFAGSENRNELTGLLKKKAFIRGSEMLISGSDEELCFVAIDIENFNLYNEWFGHEKGNDLMVLIGETLIKECDDNEGLAGYFGQDDFCVLMKYDTERIDALYDKINELISDGGKSSGFLPAFGVCVINSNSTVNNQIDRALLATRFAKESYHSRVRVFKPSMYLKSDEEFRVMTDFLAALKNNELTFNLQPQCRSSSGRIVGAEALVRWTRPDGSAVLPTVFIPVLEKHGLISELDQHIWEEVCRWIKSCIDRGIEPLPISINASPIDIVNVDLPEHLLELTEKYDLDHKYLKIEITETAYITNAALVSDTVKRLREQGFSVMMDDFGSGYSSLNMLRSLSVDAIKLDAHFLRLDAKDEIKGIHIIESVINMTKTLGIPIIVEGVDSEDKKRFLDDLGCRYVQGYYFYRPMDAQSFEKLICDPEKIDSDGITFKANQQFGLRELLDENVYSDSMLNNILGPCAFYLRRGDDVDIVRFNEQFYRAVGDPEFNDRLRSINQYMPPSDAKLILDVMERADKDRLNGASGVMRFYKTDNTVAAFNIRMYYLSSNNDGEAETKLYYGSANNVTRLATLEKQMELLSRYSPDTVIFLRTKPHKIIKVLYHGLENALGIDTETLENMLNSEKVSQLVISDEREKLGGALPEKLKNKESFVTGLIFKSASGEPVNITAFCDRVSDENELIDYIITLRNKDIADTV